MNTSTTHQTVPGTFFTLGAVTAASFDQWERVAFATAEVLADGDDELAEELEQMFCEWLEGEYLRSLDVSAAVAAAE